MNTSLPETTTAPRAIRYRLIHLVYVVTLVATSCATFGLGGLLPAVFITIFWASVFLSESRPRALLHACVITLVGSCVISFLFIPAQRHAREAARRMQCSNNLKQIGLALHNYHDKYGTFPPAYLANEKGEPMHSWRVLILPYAEAQTLYDAYDFDEPWNGPNNIKLLDPMPKIFSCPSGQRQTKGANTCTSYVAVVGPTTAWPGSGARSLDEIVDGTSQTLLLIEHDTDSIPWLEPKDLTFDAAMELLSTENPEVSGHQTAENFFYESSIPGRMLLKADGSVGYCEGGVGAQETWAAALGIDDGIAWDRDDLRQSRKSVTRLKVGNCIRLAIFLVLTIYPLPWVWLGPTKT